MKPNNPPSGGNQSDSVVHLVTCDAPAADQAFEVYSMLIRAANDRPQLRDNPLWKAFKQCAYWRFSEAFEVIE